MELIYALHWFTYLTILIAAKQWYKKKNLEKQLWFPLQKEIHTGLKLTTLKLIKQYNSVKKLNLT